MKLENLTYYIKPFSVDCEHEMKSSGWNIRLSKDLGSRADI